MSFRNATLFDAPKPPTFGVPTFLHRIIEKLLLLHNHSDEFDNIERERERAMERPTLNARFNIEWIFSKTLYLLILERLSSYFVSCDSVSNRM